MRLTHQEKRSTAELLASLPACERKKALKGLTDAQIETLLDDWLFWARPEQKPPDEYRVWLMLAGRGFGKTRTGAETVKTWIKQGVKRIALVAQTPAEARDVMVEGESGILAVSKDQPLYEPSKRRVTWPNGAIATIYSGENPGLLRGPQHEKAWVDELAKYKYPDETWHNLMMGLRLGENPQTVVTTTPRPIKLIKELMRQKGTHITRGSTYDNKANLPDVFIQAIREQYEGTRLGRQELYAEILDDNPDALWHRALIDQTRVQEVPDLVRIVVGVDPSVTNTEQSDEAGIVIAGRARDGRCYVLDDLSLKASPDGWARRAVNGYHKHKADRIIGESNQGGDMIEIIIRSIDPNVSYRSVHATKGKYLRAEPIAALYEQGKVHHFGSFPLLEDEMCEWVPGDKSPNRLDALVWALTELTQKRQIGPVKIRI